MFKPRFILRLVALLLIVGITLTLSISAVFSAPIFTGDAVADFSGPAAFKLNDPGGIDVGLPANAPPGTISGWDMRAVYIEYDPVADKLYVGFDCYGICGDADGNGDPGVAAPWLISNGGQDTANLSSFESFSLLIDTDNDYNGTTGDYDVVVGVSAFGSLANVGAYLFNQANVTLPSFGYLGILPNPVAAYASPSASAPDLELTISNFHTLPGFTFLPGQPFAFQINAFAGSLLDDGVGEDFAPAVRTPVPITFNGKLGDTVWYDLNGNGIYEPGSGEFGIGGVELCLTTALGGAPMCTLTDSAGYYEFDMLPPGAYVVTVSATNFEPGQALSGFAPTYDLDGGLDNRAGYTLGANETFLDVDFGYTLQGAIGNYVWLDENSDGYQDAGEPGLPNVELDLYDANGALAAVTETDSQGGYLFTNLAPGNYYVDVNESTLPAGATQSPYNLAGADFGNQDHSSVAIPGGGLTGYPVTLGPGQENLTADFGYNFNPPGDVNNNQGLSAVGDRVWSDSDGDGVQDSEEVGLAGVTVQLFTAGPDGLFGTPDDVAGPTDITDANGYYLFDNLTPGAYVVKVTTPPAGYTQTGDPDHFGTSGGNNDNQTTTPVLLAPGDVFVNADFGYQPPAAQNNSLGDKVWFDADADGVGPNGNGGAPGNDNTETGIPGVSVALIADLNNNGVWDAGEPIIASDVTDAAGDYLFTGLPDGSYLVWVNDTANVLSAYAPTYDRDGGAASFGSGAPIGATAGATLGLSSALNLGVGSATPVTDLTQDFGYTASNQTAGEGLIGDRVWLDSNGDGVQDANEPGLEGLTVILKDNNGNTIGLTTTDENGNYYFGGLATGTYTVVVTPPAGMGQTFDADGLGSPHQSTVVIGPGGINLDQDFGYRGTGTIGDLVWQDLNANGSFDGGEPGFGGVTLDLYWDLNGNSRIDSGEPLVGYAATAANGSYLFSGLPVDDGNGDAQFVVRVTDAAGILAGYWHSLGAVGVNNNSQSDPYAATLTPGAPSNLTADFGYFVRAAALGNFVWNDLNANGIQDNGEPGLNNVQVTLTAYYAGGVAYSLTTLTGDDPATATVEMGWYGFGNLLLDEDTASSTTGAPSPTQPVYTLAAPTAPYGLIPTLVGAPGSTALNDSDNHNGVDGLATQGRVDVVQNADPNTESNPNASYDFGFYPSPAEVAVEKTQITSDPILVGDEVVYNIRITNTGPTVIDILPLQDAYDVAYLSYAGATPSSDDNVDDGVINWSDLTIALGNLNPGNFVDVTVRFTAVTSTNSLVPGATPLTGVTQNMGAPASIQSTSDTVIGGINLGELPGYLFFFADGSQDANWQGATKGFIGNVAVDGLQATERTSGGVPYAGTIYTNDSTLSAWASIVDQNDPPQVNPAQAFAATGQTSRISDLEADLQAAMAQITALPATNGYASVSSTSLNGLNVQNGTAQTFVINITSGLNFSSKITIKGDAGDVFVLRWDTDGNPANGYQGQVKPQSGGAIVPLGGLKPTNFINVAGDINSSGGGSNPSAPYPQGPRYNDGTGALIAGGSNFSGGGFFTGYWLTTGNPTSGDTASLSNGIFVGGWYTTSDKFSMTSGTSGVYVSPNPNTLLTKDYGDAPDTGPGTGVGNYNTLATDNGPNHTIVANLRLGSTAPDADNGALQNATASADDANGVDDEDGITVLPDVTTDSTSVALTVNVYNNTGANATVACWMDFNRDGDFLDAGERVAAIVGSSASQQSVNLTFAGFAAPSEGPSYLRCRLANNAAEVANPTGAAGSGEVEDYALTINEIVTTCDVATVIGATDVNGGVATTVSDDACTQIERPGSIGDLVWYDINGDGLFQPDAGEIGIGGVEICLSSVGGGTPQCTTTDNTGYYLFDNLPPDSYVVTVSAENFEPTEILAELKQTFDADAIFDHQTTHDLASNEDYLNADFGYTRCAACKGGVVSAVFRYIGATPATVLVVDRNNVTLFNDVVNPGDLVPLANPKPTDKYQEPTFYVNGSIQVNRLKMDCSLQMGRGVTYGDFEVVRSVSKDSGPICPAPTEQCAECKGGVTALSIKYNGLTAANIQVKQDDGTIIFSNLVNPGNTFTFNGVKSGGTMGTNITVWVNGALYKTIHTSCSQAIYVGQIIGDLEIVAGSSKDNGAFCSQVCAVCSGGVTFLKLQYMGLVPATIQVKQSDGVVIFNRLVSPGEIFSFTGLQSDNKMSNEIAFFINGAPHTTLHTSCSQPIEVGMLVGDFKIMGGGSKDGGLFCPRGPRFCSVKPGMFVLDTNKAKWTLHNYLDTATISQIALEWPATNGRLKKIKLDGNEIFSGLANPGVFVINSGWKNGLVDRQIEAGQIEKLEFEFENNVSRDPMLYRLTVDFVEGCHVELIPEEIVRPYCEAGKPQVLTFTYTAQDCSFSDNTQDPGKAVCTDYLPLDSMVFIRASDNSNPNATSGAIYFQGIVDVNTAFDVDATLAGQSRLGTNTYVHIFDATGALLQQSNGIHTSCSQPLLPDDQYGSLRLTGYTPEP